MQGEFRGDFTRDTFRSFKHFTRVLMQQGRVHLDADWNEQTSILLRYLQALASDLIGSHGGPVDAGGLNFTSFAISQLTAAGVLDDFVIGPGHYYVDGILCELASTPVAILEIDGSTLKVAKPRVDGLDFVEGQYVEVRALQPPGPPPPPVLVAQITDIPLEGKLKLGNASLAAFPLASKPMLRRVTTYRTQPDLPVPEESMGSGSLLVYLDVWERHISCIQDDSIREVALGGPDTATRAKIVWQVKLDPSTKVCPDDLGPWSDFLEKRQPRNRGWLKARAKQESVSTDPCIILPESSYRGAENQLYRVEIHMGGTIEKGKPTFKWSRDNSSIEYPIKTLQGSVVTLAYLWRDSRSALNVDDWVEVVDDVTVLQGNAGVLLQVESIGDPSSMTVTLKPATGPTPAEYLAGDLRHPVLRRWSQQKGESTAGLPAIQPGGDLLVQEDMWLELEDGVQIKFVSAMQSNQYRIGDYWLIPARTATGDVEWPVEKDASGMPVEGEDGKPAPVALAPHGVEHHYAPLGIISVAGGSVTLPVPADDCRKRFKTVVELTRQP